MNDISELRGLGEDRYDAMVELIGALEGLSPEQKSAALHGLADLFELFQDDFSNIRRINQPPPEIEKTERIDVLVNWLREKANPKN